MSLLNSVKLSFVLEGPTVIGVNPVTLSLEASRIDCQTLTRFIDAACGNTHAVHAAVAAGPVQVLQKSDPVPSDKAAAEPKKVKVKKEKIPGKLMQCPYCDLSMDARVLHGHVRNHHPDKYDKPAMSRYIRGEPAAAAALDKISPDTIVTGMKVRQVKPDSGRMFQGNGTVTARVGGLFEVDLGNGVRKKVDASCLAVA